MNSAWILWESFHAQQIFEKLHDGDISLLYWVLIIDFKNRNKFYKGGVFLVFSLPFTFYFHPFFFLLKYFQQDF